LAAVAAHQLLVDLEETDIEVAAAAEVEVL
jgi:hypothetical protein